ncbi:hypothetical protein IWZ03DRAFT_377263 [Phyllosticta citriasiana]|uniref:Uncharacterized protein n=1 Tax=Phyllosticta citriasiana TaxID=595635 RepID=A0ABR1KPJ7_9PEZI
MGGWVWASALHRVSLWRMRLAIVSILLYRDDDVQLVVVVVVFIVVVGTAVRMQSSMRETATDKQRDRQTDRLRVPLVSGLVPSPAPQFQAAIPNDGCGDGTSGLLAPAPKGEAATLCSLLQLPLKRAHVSSLEFSVSTCHARSVCMSASAPVPPVLCQITILIPRPPACITDRHMEATDGKINTTSPDLPSPTPMWRLACLSPAPVPASKHGPAAQSPKST